MRKLLVLALLCAVSANADAATPAYKLVSDEVLEAKRLVSIRIEQRLSDAELARIAEAAKARPAAAAGRVLVKFFLGRPQPDELPWATATFAPDLKIVINGVSAEEAAAITDEARRDTRALVGTWLMGPPVAPGRLTIYREHGKVFAEWRLRGGRRNVEELTEARWNGGSRFGIHGDDRQAYTVNRNGSLELRDKTKLIAFAEPIDTSAAPAAVATSGSGPTPAAKASGPESVVVRAVPVEGSAVGGPVAATVTARPLMTPLTKSTDDDGQLAWPSPPAASSAAASASTAATVTATTAAAPPAQTGATRDPVTLDAAKPAAEPAATAGKAARRNVVARRQEPARKSRDDQSVAALMAAKFGQR